ncbi:hypothetical protein BDP27DRAFT_1303046, partial [Rhodocollybia butyracea]
MCLTRILTLRSRQLLRKRPRIGLLVVKLVYLSPVYDMASLRLQYSRLSESLSKFKCAPAKPIHA